MHLYINIENIYLNLLNLILNDTKHPIIIVQIFGEKKLAGQAYFQKRKLSTAEHHIVITRARPLDPLTKNSSLEQLTKFIEYCDIPIKKELIYLAHEYGHARSSAGSELDLIYNKLKMSRYHFCEKLKISHYNPNAAHFETFEDRAKVIQEENFAWREAKSILSELGFRSWFYFYILRYKSLRTYKRIPVKKRSVL